MAQRRFTAKDILKLENGVIEAALDKALEEVANDCYDRPSVKKAREITLKLKIPPQSSDGQTVQNVPLVFEVGTKFPNKSMLVGMHMQGNKLVFNTEDSKNSRQLTNGLKDEALEIEAAQFHEPDLGGDILDND